MLCKIGDVEVWRILELNGPFRAPDILFPTAGPDVANVIEALDPGSVCPNTGGLILPVQGFLLRTPDHLVLVDSCVGNHKEGPTFDDWAGRDSDRFMSSLHAAGATPEDVDFVMCTHLHVDHVGWNTKLVDGRWVPTFPNAKYLFPSQDLTAMAPLSPAVFAESVTPIVEAGLVEEVSAGHKLGDHITLIPTPGHTPGHVSVLIECGDARAIITGDALHNTAQCWHPDWHFVYDLDAELAVTSRRALFEQSAECGAKVLGTHLTLPSVGRVVEKGKAFAWQPD